MSNFKIVNNLGDIKPSEKWVVPTKFNSKDRIVDEKGQSVNSDYNGRRYQIIDKREHIFSTPERLGRGFLGMLAVICTLFLALFSQSVRNLFVKQKENMHFGIYLPPSKLPTTEAEFKTYLGQCEKGVIVNSENLNRTLERLEQAIEDLFAENYDGFHDGIPGKNYSGTRLVDMFEFSATSRTSWQLELYLDHQYENCFHPQEKIAALNIIKTFLNFKFTEKVQNIQIEAQKIHITWK